MQSNQIAAFSNHDIPRECLNRKLVMIMSVEKIETVIVTAAKELSFPALYHEQKAAITSFVEGNDVFVSLPTGYGKTLCFGALP